MHIHCAQCAARFPLDLDSPFVTCPFCSCHLYLDRASSYRHMGLPVQVGPSAALDILREGAGRRRHPFGEPIRVTHMLVPFWSVRSGTLQETLPAFSPCPFPLEGFRLPAAQADWFDADRFPGFSAESPSEGASPIWEGSGAPPEISLYSVPFYRVRYGGGTFPYEVWVDASASRPFWGLSPPSGTEFASRRFLKIVAGLTLLFAAEAFLLPGGWFAMGAIALTGFALFPWISSSLRMEVRP